MSFYRLKRILSYKEQNVNVAARRTILLKKGLIEIRICTSKDHHENNFENSYTVQTHWNQSAMQ